MIQTWVDVKLHLQEPLTVQSTGSVRRVIEGEIFEKDRTETSHTFDPLPPGQNVIPGRHEYTRLQ